MRSGRSKAIEFVKLMADTKAARKEPKLVCLMARTMAITCKYL